MKAIPITFVLALGLWLTAFAGDSDAASPALLKAKQEAETRGYIFATSHDEIVARGRHHPYRHGAAVGNPNAFTICSS